ncbi:MAG: phosphate/phosphite/phosphonate ABC transporter substrate-binding protein [Proteobacteria bacterium]|nr:phosphate/phosphite/phosphonate ABC transporter substrate-binding protein [Pseudomonadota bacterium]
MPLIRFLCLCLLLFAGCSDGEQVVSVDYTKVKHLPPPKPPKAITYAYLPQYSHTISFERHKLLLTYLRQKTGLEFRQIFPDTFSEHIQMVESGGIDISFTNPFVYTTMATLGSLAFARIVEPGGGKDFQGQIIIRKDNPTIQQLEDCRGKSWIAVDPQSAGGYLFPLGLFMDHGIVADDFSEIAFAPGAGGKQENVVLAVNVGANDLGTIRKGTLDIVSGRIDIEQIRVLAETRLYPGWVISARKDFDPEKIHSITTAMFALDDKKEGDHLILKAAGMTSIITTQDQDYNEVRR